jgi:hypothetical protein
MTHGTKLDLWRCSLTGDRNEKPCRLRPPYSAALCMIKKSTKKKLKVIMLADEALLPAGDLKDYSEKQRELRKTEFDVRDAIDALGHEVISIGVSDDLSTIRGAIDAHKPDIAFNLVEEFDGIGHFDQHVVSYLELRKQAYTGCNPRGLTLAPRQSADQEDPRLPRSRGFCSLREARGDRLPSAH